MNRHIVVGLPLRGISFKSNFFMTIEIITVITADESLTCVIQDKLSVLMTCEYESRNEHTDNRQIIVNSQKLLSGRVIVCFPGNIRWD